MTPADARALFPGLDERAYLDFAGIGLVPSPAVEAGRRALDRSATEGTLGVEEAAEEVEAVRADAARLLGVDPAEVCFVRNTTEGIGWVANGLDLAPGERVIVSGGEFPSTYYPWALLRERGVHVDIVEPDGPRWPLERYVEALESEPPARVLATSWVQFATGWRTDLTALGRHCREAGTLLCVDVIQGCGVLPFDATAVDFAAADGHKWLCAPEGLGIMYVRRERIDDLRPLEPGWNSVVHRTRWDDLSWDPDPGARRFEGGSANVVGIAALGASVRVIEAVGVDRIWQHVSDLTTYAADSLGAAGMQIVSDRDRDHASGIVVFRHPEETAANVVACARQVGVVVSGPRGGGVRLSPHAWNTREDVDRLVEVLVA